MLRVQKGGTLGPGKLAEAMACRKDHQSIEEPDAITP